MPIDGLQSSFLNIFFDDDDDDESQSGRSSTMSVGLQVPVLWRT